MSAARNAVEIGVGAAVLAVAVGFLVFAADSASLGAAPTYELSANFQKADGVSTGGDVRLAGVRIGSVTALDLDPQTYEARVSMAIRDSVKLPEDSSAVIATDGLLGGAHVAIQPGGSEFMMEPGGVFLMTQGSVNLLDLVGRAIGGVAGQ